MRDETQWLAAAENASSAPTAACDERCIRASETRAHCGDEGGPLRTTMRRKRTATAPMRRKNAPPIGPACAGDEDANPPTRDPTKSDFTEAPANCTGRAISP